MLAGSEWNNSTKSLLRNCAYRSDMYYGISNASEMTPVFTRIARDQPAPAVEVTPP